jgi:hypothetical protein
MHGSQMMYATALIVAQAWVSTPPPWVRPEYFQQTGSTRPQLVQECNPALKPLFTPWQPEIGRYEVCTASESIEQVKAAGGALGWHYADVEALEALDAFGSAGSYDRFALTRLYGGTRASVAHGWREDGGDFETVTLISPYPDGSLSRLVPGTMAIRLMITR